jgi:hypothetical protein
MNGKCFDTALGTVMRNNSKVYNFLKDPFTYCIHTNFFVCSVVSGHFGHVSKRYRRVKGYLDTCILSYQGTYLSIALVSTIFTKVTKVRILLPPCLPID